MNTVRTYITSLVIAIWTNEYVNFENYNFFVKFSSQILGSISVNIFLLLSAIVLPTNTFLLGLGLGSLANFKAKFFGYEFGWNLINW